MYPDDHLTVIILSNTDDGTFANQLAKKIAPHYFLKSEATAQK
jgi:hypothetical protein